MDDEQAMCMVETQERRAALFRESPWQIGERWVLGTAWALRPRRISALPRLAAIWLKHLAKPASALPDPECSFHDIGLCGIAHEVTTETLLSAYRRGLYPFAHCGPLKWYSPPKRCVLTFADQRINKNVMRLMRQERYTVTFDRAFEEVIVACAGRRDGKWHLTWITPRIMRLYADLYDAGHVHTFEVWNRNGALVGGGYGVAVGGAFFTESQFSRESNTSKIGFAVFNRHLERWGFAFNDGKNRTPTLLEAGFREIERRAFLEWLADATTRPGKAGRWEVELPVAAIAEAHASSSAGAEKRKPSAAAA